MKTLIAIQCMDQIQTEFFTSYLQMTKPGEVATATCQGSLIYNSRNQLGHLAMDMEVDRILWLDSDMLLPDNLMEMLAADLDEGREYVSALVTKRHEPIEPCIYSQLDYIERPDGLTDVKMEPYTDYPRDSLFEIKASGFGAVMMTMDVYRKAVKRYSIPFTPLMGMGEDTAFCYRMQQMGVKMWCDSRVKPGHIGQRIFYGE